uniref:FAD synthase n=1 Tax=Trypanosoma congolense (strain IL3000) TaxID=1068625 RepID=G0V134_TRYCI|nr:unnamed protein product [Trypanosoma congolense IL3000]
MCTSEPMGDEVVRLEGCSVTDNMVEGLCKLKNNSSNNNNNNNIRCVELENCANITDISALAHIATLEEVTIRNCSSLRIIGSLGPSPPSLRKIRLAGTVLTGAQLQKLKDSRVEIVFGSSEPPTPSRGPGEDLVKESVELVRDLMKQFKPENVGIAFNGGKDSVVMMDILQCAMGREFLSQCCVFHLEAANEKEFQEVVMFREAFAKEKKLSIVRSGHKASMKECLAQIKAMKGIQVAFMGTRMADGCHQRTSVERTTAGWPDLLRACPLFSWSYEDVWGYILTYGLPFCELYSKGYTSLGSADTTLPNTRLCRVDGTFLPAWELVDGRSERYGRLNA